MQSRLKASVKPQRFFLFMTVATALATLAVLFVSDIFLPVAAGFFAALFLYDRKKLLSLLLFALSLVPAVLLGIGSVFAVLCIFAIGVLCASLYRGGTDKSFSALCVNAVFLVYLFAVLYALAVSQGAEASLSAVLDYYAAYIEEAKASFVKTVTSLTTSMTDGTAAFLMTAEEAEELFLSMTRLLLAFLAVFAFVLTGITYKVFCRVVVALDAEPDRMREYRFAPAPIFAVFYGVLFLLSLFFSNSQGSLALALNNLFYVFMAVFAYVGIRFSLFALSHARHRGFGMAIFVCFLLFANIAALELLSVFGMLVTFFGRRLPPRAEP